ncbi:MAG TPA: type II toxin-antitoxin system VapC family toxin, partial [Edaphobacter sp.]|uniref:type II toxin-antitoxin system VapC family toxin n=1 Tax=Edaphobacter sp. TaxID=1934404 RepID=UPI002BDBDF24
MTTAIDTNVLVALWDTDPQLNSAVHKALDSAQARGALVITGAVYAKLLALPGRTEKMLDEFFGATGILVEWQLSEQIWRTAGRAFQEYARRHSKKKAEMPRRILADFLIGAHAAVHHYPLLTLDRRLYRAAFPKLKIV